MWSELYQLLLSHNYSSSDIAFIKRAFDFAARAHEQEKRASGEPYIIHPIAVAQSLIAFRLDAASVAAGLLHDTRENCVVSHQDIVAAFGEEVAFLVDALTNVKKIKYRDTQRLNEPLRNMFMATAKDTRVILIKLFDRLHNMQTLESVANEKQTRIAKETLELYAPIANRLGMGELKGQLEDLAFPFVHPEEYRWLTNERTLRVEKLEHYLHKLMPLIRKHLAKEHVPLLDLHSRVKHSYSLWRKLLRYEMDFDRIHDISAIRLMVPSIEDCYTVLGIIHHHWRPLPGRIKDYIAIPKPNGYQSLHTTVFCPHHQMVEFQIRTPEMHERAEFGIAAHWAYKEQAGTNIFRDWQKEGKEFFNDRIFVLSPKGEIFDLPRGSTSLDFAYHIHSDIGDHATGAKINGKLVSFGQALSSGEAVEITTHHRAKPKAEWLEHARTSLARRHIRAALHKMGVNLPRKQKEKIALSCVFRIRVKDRVGLLHDLSAIFSQNNVNISDITVEHKNTKQPAVVIRCTPKKSINLANLVTIIKAVKGVKSVEMR
jgi:GTP pyrophosphokinase